MTLGAAGTVVTVGSFDGMHRGHVAVLQEIARRADATGRRSVLVTFEPHPMEVVNPAAAPLRLTTAIERLEVLAQTPVGTVAILRFDESLRGRDPESFVREVLVARFGVRELVIGEDRFDASSVLDIQWAGGKIQKENLKEVVFEGDSRTLKDIQTLASVNYGEDLMGKGVPLPKELKYLR
jgi:cytidyltransferase-like protein